MTRTPQPFVVSFEYAQRSFKCVRLDWSDTPGSPATATQWIVTMAGRPVWSFDSAPGDTRKSVRAQVEKWWDGERASQPQLGTPREP